MRFTKKMENYVPLVPPIVKNYIDFSDAEAKEYFEWFLSHIDERSDYLRSKVADDLSISIDELNYSIDSLKIVWNWFLGIAEVKKCSQNIFSHSFGLFSDKYNVTTNMINDGQSELTVFTYYVLRDIGMYIGKVFKINFPILEWSYKTKPKNYISVNEPLLIGFVDNNPTYPKPFYPDLEPISFVESCALNLLDKSHHPDDLYNQCLKWIKWIPKT